MPMGHSTLPFARPTKCRKTLIRLLTSSNLTSPAQPKKKPAEKSLRRVCRCHQKNTLRLLLTIAFSRRACDEDAKPSVENLQRNATPSRRLANPHGPSEIRRDDATAASHARRWRGARAALPR